MTWHFFHLHLNQPKQTGPQGMPIRLAAMHTCGNMCSLCNDITKRLAVQVCRVCVENSRLTESWETIRGKLVHVPRDVKPQMLRLVDTRIIFRYSKYQSRGHDVVRHHIHSRTHTHTLSLSSAWFLLTSFPLYGDLCLSGKTWVIDKLNVNLGLNFFKQLLRPFIYTQYTETIFDRVV